MVLERLISLDQPDVWRTALEGVPHGFGHTWENCRAMQFTTGLATFLYVHQQNDTRIVCALSERCFEGSKDVVTPSGISGFASNGTIPEFPKQWRAFARRQGYVCGYIALNPLFENAAHYGRLHELNTLYHLDLSLGATELLRRADRSRRRLVHDWQRSGNVYITDRVALTAFLVAHHRNFMRRAGATAGNFFNEGTLRSISAAPEVDMVGAGTNGVIEAVYVFARTPWVGDCLFNVSTPAGKVFTTALLWWGVERYSQLGVPYLNLGAGARPNDNITRTKLMFRPERRTLHCLKEVYRRQDYERQCRLVLADPDDNEGFFPPFWAPAHHGEPTLQ